MSRKLAILAGVFVSGLSVAAIVNAQNATQSRSPSLSDRLGQIRDQLVGGDDTADEPQAAPTASQRRPTDWSAGRKFGAPSRSRTIEEQREEEPVAPRHNVPPPSYGNKNAPSRRGPNSALAPRTAAPNRTAGGAPASARTPASSHGFDVERTPAGNYAARTDATKEPTTSTTAAPRVAVPPSAAPRAIASGVSADSPLKNRLQALREERFDEVVGGDNNLTTQAKTAKTESPAAKQETTTTADTQWRSAAPPATIDASPAAPTSEAPTRASRYSDERPVVAKDDSVHAEKPRSSTLPTDTATSPVRSGRYSDDRVGAAPSISAATPAAEKPPAYVARRAAIRPSIRDNAPGAVKPTDSIKAANQETSAESSGALLASKSPILSVRTVGPRTVTIGKPAKYELLLENGGDAAANEVLVTVKLPAWAQIEGAQPTAGAAKVAGKSAAKDGDDDGLQWRVSRLDAGAKQRLVMQIVPRQSTPFQLAVQWTFVPEVAKTIVEVQEPKLQLALDGPKEMHYGANEVYRITLSNPGTGDAENVTVLTSSAASATDGMNKLTVGTLAAGATKTLELKIVASQAGTLHVSAKATADGNLSSQAAADVLVRRAALKLAAAGPQANYAGTQAAYEVRVANPGSATAENVRVEATLPIGAKFDKCSAGGAAASDGAKVVWTVPSLAAGSERAFELTCTVMSAGANRLQVAASAQGQLSDTAEVATRVEALADLKLEVADPRGPVAVGADAAYEVRIRNRGTKTAERINVVGFFSEGIEPVAATGLKYTIEAGQIAFATIDAIDANEEVIVKITARASVAGNHVFRAELVCESTETRLVVEETTKFYGDGPVKPAAHFEDVGDGQGEGAGEATGEAIPTGDGVMPSLVPPSEGEGELQPLSLLDE